MSAAPLQRTAPVPVAAAPTPQGGGGGGVTPAAGQGFVPAQGGPAGPAAEPAADQGAPATGPDGKAAPTPEQILQSITQLLGADYGEPIIAADGTIYMEKKKPTVVNGKLALSYLVVGKLDKASGKLTPSAETLALVKAKASESQGGKKVLVKVGEQMVWQTFGKDENGKPVVTEMSVATEQEIAAYQQQQQAAAAQQAAQQKLQNRGDWQSKVGVVAQQLGIFGSTGQLISGLSAGPNPYSGKPGAGWISGYILASRLNGKAEGKLLPQWFSQGPFATALDWGIQAYGMLDMGSDITTLRNYFSGTQLPPVNPNAVAQLVKQGQNPAVAGALNQLGTELRDGTLQLVAGSPNTAVLNTKLGAAQLVPKADLYKAFAATDPVQSAGLKLRGNIDSGVTKGLGVLKGLVQPAMIGATALGLVSSAIGVKNLVDAKGGQVLLNTQQGRGAALGVLTSSAFLGMYLLPMILPGLGVAMPAIAAASSVVNIAQNVLGGVQLLNSYGLFGGEQKKNGFLDNDAVRAAFLIPPLTPIGAFAFWMKSKKKKQVEEAARLEAAQKLAVERITQQREMAKLQLQSTGQISGAVQGKDGTISVQTSVPNDLSQLAAQISGGVAAPAASAGASPDSPGGAPTPEAAPATGGENAALAEQRRQLTMTTRPMR